MTKILLIIPAFKHGGTNKSLLNLLSFIGDEFDVSILALSHLGPYKNILNEKAKIIKKNINLGLLFDDFGYIDFKKDNKKQIVIKLLRKSYRKIFKMIIGQKYREKILNKYIKKIENMNFDTVVAMQEGDATNFTARIKGKKIAWIRCDYDEYYKVVKIDESAVYKRFQSIICVSEYTRKVFINRYPQLEARCHSIHNMIDYNKIINMSLENIEEEKMFNTSFFTIVSIGRLCRIKQFDLIPFIADGLIKKGLSFIWYIIGDGEERIRINQLIEKHNVEGKVVLLGEKDNPYPYIRLSDLVVVTSLSEACPNVINEAKILHIPVVTTNFGSANEFIKDGVNGIITTRDNIVNDITNIIRSLNFYSNIKLNARNFLYSNEVIIARIIDILK